MEVLSTMQSLLHSLAQPTFTVASTTKLSCPEDFNLLLDAIQDTDEPNVRLKMARLALLWLPLPEVTSPQVVGCVHILATDVWSQIRKDAAVAVGRVLPVLPWSTVEAVLHDLLQVFKQPPDEGDDDWKGREGAFRVLASMLAQFKKNTTPPSTGFSLGTRMMQYLPSALLCDLKPAVYQAMQHPQLSVREHATAAIIRYVALSDAFTQISTFQEVMSKLNLYSPHEVLPAAHAEGLLDVAAQLVPHIPLPFLTKHWQVVFPTCEKYVMHVASTVRQKSAGLIGALATLSTTSIEAIPLLASILESLALPCSQHPDANQREFFWQRMEGRLMGIDSLVHVLGVNKLTSISSQLLAPPTKPAPKAFQSFQHTMDELLHFDNEYATLMGTFASWVGEKTSPRPSHCILAQLPPNLLHRIWHAYVRHTYECFQSPQYELKRMAVQTLPGLVRLSVWLDDPAILVPAWLPTVEPVHPTFICLVIKSLALHTRFLHETITNTRSVSTDDPRILSSLLITATIETALSVLQSLQPALLAVDVTLPVDKALSLAYVEAGALLLLFQSATALDTKTQPANALLLQAVLNVLWASHVSDDPAVDRAMSSTVVRYLPGLALLPLTQDQATRLIQISLSWLSATDSLRWIVVDGNEARCHLVDALAVLALHARPPLTNVWNLHDITTAAAPFLLHPTVPLRLFAKLLVLVSAVAAFSRAECVRPLLHLLLRPEISFLCDATTATFPTTSSLTPSPAVFNEWDDDSGQTAAAAPTTDRKAVCFQAFWTSFDAPSASGGRVSDLVTGTCTPDERLTLETLQRRGKKI